MSSERVRVIMTFQDIDVARRAAQYMFGPAYTLQRIIGNEEEMQYPSDRTYIIKAMEETK